MEPSTGRSLGSFRRLEQRAKISSELISLALVTRPWLSWNSEHFTRHAGMLYFQHLIRPRLLGEAPDAKAVEEAAASFKQFARVLDDHLRDRLYLLGDQLTIADFAVGVTLPYAEEGKIPLAGFQAIERWRARLAELPAWQDPFHSRVSAAA